MKLSSQELVRILNIKPLKLFFAYLGTKHWVS